MLVLTEFCTSKILSLTNGFVLRADEITNELGVAPRDIKRVVTADKLDTGPARRWIFNETKACSFRISGRRSCLVVARRRMRRC